VNHEVIDSADDPRVADYVGLKGRSEHTDFVIVESPPVVARLVGSRFKPRSFLLTPSQISRMEPTVQHFRVPVYVAERSVMEQITGYDVHRGVLASARRAPQRTLSDLLVPARRIVVLEGSNDHENIGAVARSARALGVDALLLDPTCADPFARRSIRVSMGELLHLPVLRSTTWPDPLDWLTRYGFETWGLTPAPDANSLYDMGMPERVALVAGAEGSGLTPATLSRVQYDVRIPMHHGVDSLNLGHALAIAMAAVAPPVTE